MNTTALKSSQQKIDRVQKFNSKPLQDKSQRFSQNNSVKISWHFWGTLDRALLSGEWVTTHCPRLLAALSSSRGDFRRAVAGPWRGHAGQSPIQFKLQVRPFGSELCSDLVLAGILHTCRHQWVKHQDCVRPRVYRSRLAPPANAEGTCIISRCGVKTQRIILRGENHVCLYWWKSSKAHHFSPKATFFLFVRGKITLPSPDFDLLT